MPGFVKKCDDSANFGFIQKDELGFEQPCCTNPWYAAIYVAGFNVSLCGVDPPVTGNDRQHLVAMGSIRSDSESGTVFDVALPFSFAVDDPDNPCTIDNPGGGYVILQPDPADLKITLTAGYDTAGVWEHFATISGHTVDAVGSLGTPFTADVPTVDVWINAFRAVGRFSKYALPPEYGIPLECKVGAACGPTDDFTPADYPVKWKGAYDAANAQFGIDPDVTSSPPGFTRTNGVGTVDDFSYYDPDGLVTINVNPANDAAGSGDLGAIFWEAFYATPKSKTPDDLFDLVVQWKNIYKTVKNSCEEAIPGAFGWALPLMALFFPIDSEEIVWESIEFEPCPSSDIYTPSCVGYKWTFKNCRFLTRKGTKFLNVWAEKEAYRELCVALGGSQFYFTLPWITKSGPIRIKTGTAKLFAVIMEPYTLTLAPQIAGAALRDQVSNPLRVRVLDLAGSRSGRYNIVLTATHLISVALGEIGTNYYDSPALEGDVEVNAVAGVADFSNLAVIGLGRNYQLEFTAPAPLTPHLGGSETVYLSVAADLLIDDPGPVAAGDPIDIVVRLVDAHGDPLVPSAADDLILSGEGGFTGYGTVNPITGVATFSGNFPGPGSFTLKAETDLTNYDGPNDASGNTIPARSRVVVVT